MLPPFPIGKKILFLFAHPDDETLTSGLMAHAAAQGSTIIAYYASRGEGGLTNDLCTQEELGSVRMDELARSARILGVSQLIIKNHGDGRLPQRLEAITEDVLRILEDERSDQVITLPPSGITNHDDHKVVQLAGLRAVIQHGSSELYYRLIPSDSTGIVGVEHDDLKVTHQIDVRSYQKEIFQAMESHSTQRGAMSTIYPALQQDRSDLLWNMEYYHKRL